MKKVLSVAFGSLMTVASTSAFAGAMGMADLTISALGLVNAGGALPASALSISNESRTGIAGSSFNGVVGTGAGLGTLVGSGSGAIDVKYRCAGPGCGSIGALYGGAGNIENNTTTHLAPPPTLNYGLGDMLISGSAIGGSITGLTRANAMLTGPTNIGSGNATILNSASISANFSVGTTFTGSVAVSADAFVRAWVDATSAGEVPFASAGHSWVLNITCTTTATNNCGGFTTLSFAPGQLNVTRNTGKFADNDVVSFTGTLLSDVRTYNENVTYNLSIIQAANSTVTSVPEPSTVALLGAALAGFGGVAAKRRKQRSK